MTEAQTALKCPECGSDSAFKNGTRDLAYGEKAQRFICRSCGHRYTDPYSLNIVKDHLTNIQIGAKAKNLVSTTKTEVVGGNININQFLYWMKNQGYKQSTIDRRQSALKGLQKLKADLSNPESVKSTIAHQEHWKDSQKQVVVFAYDLYAKQCGYTWNRPFYEAIRELPFIPQEREIAVSYTHLTLPTTPYV